MSNLRWRLTVFGFIGAAMGYFVGEWAAGGGGLMLGVFTGLLIGMIIAGASNKGRD